MVKLRKKRMYAVAGVVAVALKGRMAVVEVDGERHRVSSGLIVCRI